MGNVAIIAKGELLVKMFKLSTMFVSREGLKSNIFIDPEKAMGWLENSNSITFH
jgi:hypothetical protein